ncbi:MAG: hypothetical protein ACYTG5_23395 [Planctomycetota bacterium]
MRLDSFLEWVRTAPLEEVREFLDRAELQYLDRARPGWPEKPGEFVAVTSCGRAYHLLDVRTHPSGLNKEGYLTRNYLRCQTNTQASETMSQEKARIEGYAPCRICRHRRLNFDGQEQLELQVHYQSGGQQ